MQTGQNTLWPACIWIAAHLKLGILFRHKTKYSVVVVVRMWYALNSIKWARKNGLFLAILFVDAIRFNSPEPWFITKTATTTITKPNLLFRLSFRRVGLFGCFVAFIHIFSICNIYAHSFRITCNFGSVCSVWVIFDSMANINERHKKYQRQQQQYAGKITTTTATITKCRKNIENQRYKSEQVRETRVSRSLGEWIMEKETKAIHLTLDRNYRTYKKDIFLSCVFGCVESTREDNRNCE